MRVSLNLPEELVTEVDARDYGRGRSATITAIVQRYLSAVRESLRGDPPTAEDIDAVGAVLRAGLADEEARTLSATPLARLALLDAAERAAKGGTR